MLSNCNLYILHVPAWPGGLPVPRALSTFQTVYPGLNIANITIAQNGEVERRRHTEKIIQNRNELIKSSYRHPTNNYVVLCTLQMPPSPDLQHHPSNEETKSSN